MDAGLRVDSPVTPGVGGLLSQSRAIVPKRHGLGNTPGPASAAGARIVDNCPLIPADAPDPLFARRFERAGFETRVEHVHATASGRGPRHTIYLGRRSK